MHAETEKFILECVDGWTGNKRVLDIGAFDINGSVKRILEPHGWSVLGVDLRAGPGVDYVCRGEFVSTVERWFHAFPVVTCCEVLEHTSSWRKIIDAVQTCVQYADAGMLIMTWAGPGRIAHGLEFGDPENYYCNLTLHGVVNRIFPDFSEIRGVHDDGDCRLMIRWRARGL